MIEHFYQDIPGYFTFEDFYTWVAGRLPERARCVEVGVFAGRSAAFLGVELLRAGKSVSLDLVDQSFNDSDIRRTLAPISHVVGQVHRGVSWEMARYYDDASLDFAFIDAGHEYEEVKSDIAAWCPKVKPGGVLAGHDLAWEYPGLVRAVTEAFEHFRVWRGSQWSNGMYYPTWWVER